MVMGGQPVPIFLQQNSRMSHLFPCRSSMIARSCETRPMGWKGIQFGACAILEAVGAYVFPNFWLPLTMGRNKMALAGHPRPCGTHYGVVMLTLIVPPV